MATIHAAKNVRKGNIPTMCGIRDRIKDVRRHLEVSPRVVGAIVGGSIIKNEFSLSSDADILVFCREVDFAEVAQLRLRLKSTCLEMHFPLEIIILTNTLAATRFHGIGWGFLQHWVYAAENGGLIKENCLDWVATSGLSPEDDLHGYLVSKMRYFSENMPRPHTGEECLKFSGKVLGSPFHLARKMLAVKERRPYVAENRFEIVTAAEAAFPMLFPTMSKVDLLRHEYDAVLKASANHFDDGPYRRLLETIEHSAPSVYSLFATVATSYSDLF